MGEPERARGSGRGPGYIAEAMANFVYKIVSTLFELILWAVNIIVMAVVIFLRIIGRTIRIIMVYMPHIVDRAVPKRLSGGLGRNLVYAGVEMTADEVISVTLVYSIVVTIVAYVIAVIFSASPFVLWSVVGLTFLSIWILPSLAIGMLINKRVESVESMLPDVLSIISQNMMAGMTSYNALWEAARPEFGPLADEIQGVARSTLTGVPLTDAMLMMTNNVKSDKLARSVRLIIQGMKSGGDLPEVLQSISKDMRMEYNLKKQMAAETSAHAIFIIFAIFVGAPILFAVSLQFITIFSTLLGKLNISDIKSAPESMISLSGLSVTPEFYQMYAMAILFVSGFFGAFLIGILRTGKAISGLPSVPIMVLVPLGVFVLLKMVLNSFFSSLFVI